MSLEDDYNGNAKERAFMGDRQVEQCAVSNMTTDQAIELGITSMDRLRELIEAQAIGDDYYAGMVGLYSRLEQAADKLQSLLSSRR